MKYCFRQLLNDTLVAPVLRNRDKYPFTDEATWAFFQHFADESFDSSSEVRCIVITGGALKPPDLHSYADGYLLPYSADEFVARGDLNDAVASIHLEHGRTSHGTSVQPLPGRPTRIEPKVVAPSGAPAHDVHLEEPVGQVDSNGMPPTSEVGSASAERLYERARVLYKNGERKAALECLNQAVALAPEHCDAWFWKGNCHSSLGQLEEAVRCYQVATRLVPCDEYAWLAMGEDLVRLDRILEAIDCFKKAVSLNPTLRQSLPPALQKVI